MPLWGSEEGETHLTQFSSQRDTVLTWNSEQISHQNINWIAKQNKTKSRSYLEKGPKDSMWSKHIPHIH